jgi:hypothetical protein
MVNPVLWPGQLNKSSDEDAPGNPGASLPLESWNYMKSTTAFIIASILLVASFVQVHAQGTETIWLTTNITEFKTGEIVTLSINAVSATPIQGFNFQIRYDPACVTPLNATSPISGMNGLSLPQNSGLVDASFASTTPQTANGVIAEVRFTTLGGCQTDLTLENAALAIRNESGFAAPLTGISVGSNKVSLNIDSAKAEAQELPVLSGTPLSLAPNTLSAENAQALPAGTIGVISVLGVILLAGIFILIRQLRGSSDEQKTKR